MSVMKTEDDDDASMQSNPAFLRLMELKNLYNMTRKTLGPIPKDSSRPSPAPAPSAPAASTQAVESLTTRKHKETTPEPQHIQKTIRSVILKHGGSSHVDTIVEYVRLRWPNLRKRDGTLYTISDTKKTVQSSLRIPGSSRDAPFVKDEEGNLLMSEDESKDVYPLANHIGLAIDDGHSSLQAITNFVLEKWPRPKDVESTDKEISEGVGIALKTNPKFKKDGRNCFSNVVSPKKSRFPKNGSKRPRSTDDEGDSDEDQKNSESDSNTNKRNSGLYGKKDKKDKKLKEKDKEKDVDLNPWICCDRCQKWVRAKTDNIDDISIYDDSNPNHLDYYCPSCRASGKRNKPRRGGRAEETVTTVEKAKSTRGSALITSTVSSSIIASTNGSNERGKRRKMEEDASSGVNGNSSKPPADSKLDAVEKELLSALEERADDMQEVEEAEKMRANLNRLTEDLRKFKTSLVATRNTIWDKNQKDFDIQLEKLEQDKRALNERAEADLVKQLRDFYTKRLLNSAK